MSPIKSFWNLRIRISYSIIAVLALLYFIFIKNNSINASHHVQQQEQVQNTGSLPSIYQYRMDDYRYAHPLLITDILNLDNNPADKDLNELSTTLHTTIELKKAAGEVSEASVYVRTLKNARWITVNGDEHYKPASLGKVPLMMALLRQSEMVPGFLNKQIFFEKPAPSTTFQFFPPPERLKPGRSYTVKELLSAAIIHSDNDATDLLVSQLNMDVFNELFADLDLPDPALGNREFELTVSDFSKFLRVLYNATYISNENADFALSLLAKSDFKQGMAGGLPAGVVVAHKFGESGEASSKIDKQFHESGIIYIENNPVMVTVMTRGKDIHKLPGVVAEITRRVYEKLSKTNS